jgi:hypothetical protein
MFIQNIELFGFVCLVLVSTGINRIEYGMATK